MALITKKPIAVYDLTVIERGYLLWGKHCTWTEGRAGFVTEATEQELTVQYHPGIGNVTNHFVIPVSEVEEGQWEIRWSADMSEIFEYGMEEQEPEEPEEPGGGDGNDDTGGTDL